MLPMVRPFGERVPIHAQLESTKRKYILPTVNNLFRRYACVSIGHVCVRATTVEKRDNDYHRLVNYTVERHTRCSAAYCLKQIEKSGPACRMQIWFSKAITGRNRTES